MSPGRLDPRVVRRHLLALREVLGHLDRHRERTAEDLAADADLRWTVERGLQLAAQNVLDLATHVAAASGRDAPDYATAIVNLGEIGVLSSETAQRLRDLAGFRNVLVHAYLDVDLNVVEQVLAKDLDDVERFATSVEQWLRREHTGEGS